VGTAALAPWLVPSDPYLIDVVKRYGMDMTRRFIVVDLASQTMTVWDPGFRTRIIPVSTGDETRGYRTLAWYGLVGDYWGTFQASGVYADEGWYLFEDAGHILIHGAPYKRMDGQKAYEDMEALGTYPASKGCIRLAPDDALWFTEWNPQGVPIVILPKDEALGIN
jgi:lipoprotein-anchoring transpeptidase ErfK/SrfK